MGRSPQLILENGRVLCETNTIAKYLIDTYDTDNKFKGDGAKNDSLRDSQLSDFVQASLGGTMILGVIFHELVNRSPFLARPITGGVWKGVRSGYYDGEMQKSLSYLDSELEGQDYLMGASPGRCDFLLSFVYDNIEQRHLASVNEYVRLKAWRERCRARPAWKRGLERGNGYNLSGT
jgi:glutathione S-transferase